MSDEILPLAKKFLAIRSQAGNPQGLAAALDLAVSNLKGYTIERFTNNGVKSILVHNAKVRPKKFRIILNGHLDVVPGSEGQYIPKIKGNRLYGVGSMDMKANVACLISAFKHTAHQVNYPLALQLVTDEEIGGFDGTKYQVEKGVRADFVIAGEPTNFDIVHKAKGVLWLTISARGKTAHGAYPWRGDNAIWKMADFLSLLKKKYPIPHQERWITTVNLSQIETSNRSFNKIPDDCAVKLDIRYIQEDADKIVKDVKKILPKGFLLEVHANESALHTDPADKYLATLQRSASVTLDRKIVLRGANGTSDARHFARVGCPGIEFGPIGGDIGSDHEWVDIPSLGKYSRILETFLLSL